MKSLFWNLFNKRSNPPKADIGRKTTQVSYHWSDDGTAKNYYCGDFVYDGSLAVAYILTPNGQLTRNPSTGTYTSQYNITDHLGNVRSVVSSSGTVLQSTDYYPFGLAFSDSNIASNRYLYNGKEIEDYTLGTAYLGTLDYGARHYDPRIARWTVPDPMAEKYYGVHAYSYCAGNPVMMVDPDGKHIWTIDQNGEVLNKKKDKTQDAFILVNAKGEQVGSISFGYKTVKEVEKREKLKVGDTEKKVSTILLSSEEAGADLFKFLADNSDKEFGLITMKNKNSLVMTSHESRNIPISLKAKELDRKWETRVLKIIHNHPHNTPPSGYDRDDAGRGDKAGVGLVKNADHYVYQPSMSLLIYYDNNGIKPPIRWETVFPNSVKR